MPLKTLRDLIPQEDVQRYDPSRLEQDFEADIHPVHPPGFKGLLPGDSDIQSHPLYTAPNPYMKYGWTKLKRLWDKGLVPEDKVALVKQALLYLSDDQAWGPDRPCIAIEQPEVVYQPPLFCRETDCEIVDLTQLCNDTTTK